MQVEYKYIFRVSIIGDSSVGKSSILLRLSDDIFPQGSFIPTIGVDFKTKHLEIQNNPIKIGIWDTAGQERFRTIIRSYYKGSHAFILVFDLTDRESFNNIKSWWEDIKEHGQQVDGKQQMILVGNKSDLEEQRQVNFADGQDLAQSLGCVQYIETSAKNGNNIEKALFQISTSVYNSYEQRLQTGNNKSKIQIGRVQKYQSLGERQKQYCQC